MRFEEIFEEDGLYQGTDFVEGFCFKIMGGSLYGCQYHDVNSLLPEITNFHCYAGLFKKSYKKVLIIKQLFEKYSASPTS